jgi:anthranilate phosphoribosyltransferase
MREVLEELVQGRELSAAAMEAAIESIFTGAATPAQIAALLIALRMKGESAGELAAAARVMRRHALPVKTSGKGPLLDTCGTGGDGSGSFNVSTAAAIVVAACGVRVAKHGNRAASSKSGSADVLEALGIDLTQSAELIGKSIDGIGIGFMFARSHHPAMKHAAPVRAELGVRTLFNFLGPLSNPAGATHQLLGVGDGSKLRLMADVLRLLGAEGAWVVHGHGGLDEISVSGETRVIELKNGDLQERTVTPEDFGVERSATDALRGGDAAENAQMMRDLFAGERGAHYAAKRDAVVVNAGAALCVAGAASSPREGAARAAQALDSGAASAKLAEWIAFGRANKA